MAEEDLKLRGPGQFFGSMQHGLPDLKIADVLQDIDILLQARRAALETMGNQVDLAYVLPVLELQYKEHFTNITFSIYCTRTNYFFSRRNVFIHYTTINH